MRIAQKRCNRGDKERKRKGEKKENKLYTYSIARESEVRKIDFDFIIMKQKTR
jgi:hypothetical protein